jgi:hypothetical protein
MTKKKSEFLTKAELLSIAARGRDNYLGPDKQSSLYTSWRARVFTAKGRTQGFPETWHTFKGFKNEMSENWSEGKILVRKNSSLPFSRENCEWLDKGMENLGKLTLLAYNGEIKTLIEWSKEFDLNYNGVRQRYFKGKNYTKEQILFGKNYKAKRDIHDYKKLEYQKKRNKLSRMFSAYKLRDKKRDLAFDLTKEFLEDIVSQPCTYCGSVENVGCDRIDNKKGHTMNNIIPACYTCNTVRNNLFTVDEMKKVGKVIREITNGRRKCV